MNNDQNLALQVALEAANWQGSTQLKLSTSSQKPLDWLLEMGSMTKRIEALGQSVVVIPHQEHFITQAENRLIGQFLPDDARYWLRDITLFANDEPWLIARTFIPESTLQNENQQLVDLGTIPLGRYLFTHPKLTRDFIEIGIAKMPKNIALSRVGKSDFDGKHLWARRSLLRINQKPLLLSELFLPSSALY